MKIEVTVEAQPLAFIRRQPPDTRKKLRAAIHAIERGDSFPEPLEDELEGFYKMRVENCRLILQHESPAKPGRSSKSSLPNAAASSMKCSARSFGLE